MQKITFEDYPSTNTPINATNLNAVQTNAENAIDSLGTSTTTAINNLKPVSLYTDANGTQGNITLSDSAANYTYIEIYYLQGSSHGSSRFFEPNGKEITIFHRNMYDASHIHNVIKNYSVSGTSITVLRGAYSVDTTGSTPGTVSASTSLITIYKVVGYK